jgi:hypothetical protein
MKGRKTLELPAGTAAELAPELARQRGVADAYRTDELERDRAEAGHKRNRADVAEETRRAELARAEREASASADADLARMYREARDAGERTRVAAELARSGEARTLRLERLRTANLRVLVPVLTGFAAWSTTGVQHGAARLMRVTAADPMWWALWVLEPVLIGAVVWVIIARARLAASGGRMDPRAVRIAAGCLLTSIGLNLVAAVNPPAGGWTLGGVLVVAGAMLAHAIGPVGAATTAHLIGIVDESVTAADPWTERGERVPRLADLDLTLKSAPESAIDSTVESITAAVESAGQRPPVAWPVPVDGRRTLPIVARHKAPSRPAITAGRTEVDLAGQQPSKAARKPRPNKGTKVPAAARKAATEPSPRELSDEQLRQRLQALVTAGELPQDAAVRRVQTALGTGFQRAKRVMALAPMAGQLTVMDAVAEADRDGQDRDEVAA